MAREDSLRAFMQAKVDYRVSAAAPSLAWSLARRLEPLLAKLPPSCLGEWGQAPGGLIVFGDAACEYSPGAFTHQGRTMCGAAMLPTHAFLEDASPGVRVISRLLDHLLGSYFDLPARFITEEPPGADGWDAFHRRLVAAHQAGYADDERARESTTDYFAWAFAGYMLDRKTLSATDPLADRLFRSTLFSEAFWRRHPRRPCPEGGAIV